MYHGVDVVEVVATTGVVRLAAAASEDLAGWVLDGGGGALPSGSTTPIARLVRTSSRRLPLLEFANNSYDERGTYVAWRGRVQLLKSGYYALATSVTSLSFEVVWSCPVWEVFEFNPNHQHEHVLRALDRLIAVAPAAPPDLLMLSDDSMGTRDLPVLPASRIGLTQYVAINYVFTPVTALVLFCVGAIGASLVVFSIPMRRPEWLATAETVEDVDDGEAETSDWIIPASRSLIRAAVASAGASSSGEIESVPNSA